ncbi:MAG: hypothetical protein R3D68_12705 [Hyphomicrobiaceae bacterium]
MRDFLESAAAILKRITGYEIPTDVMPYLVVGITLGPSLIWLYWSIRRWRGDFKAISGELHLAAEFINHKTRGELNQIVDRFSRINDEMKGVVIARIDALQMYLRPTEEVKSREADRSIESEPEVETPGKTRVTRLLVAQQVRNAVVEKWLDGRYLRPCDDDRGCFEFDGYNQAGDAFVLRFQTPYRATIGDDGRLPFTLEVWVAGYKKLNFEWDSEGKYALRGFTRGDWVEDVAQWGLTQGVEQQRVA